MKCLFIAGGTSSSAFALAALATSVRNEGHEILIAGPEPVLAAAETIGIPAASIALDPLAHFMRTDRSGNAVIEPEDPREFILHIGRSYARMAAAGLDALVDLTQDWRPDVVAGGSMSYAAGLLAARLEVPYVRQAWDIIPTAHTDPGAEEELRPELKRLGLAELPAPDLFIDVCPPSLQPPGSTGAQPMRWISGNRQRRLEPWMYTRQEGRRRILITSGTRGHLLQASGWPLRRLVDQQAEAGVEVLIAAPERAADALGGKLGDVHIGWIPLDIVAPTCDLIMHHGGGITCMTALSAGVPQLITAENPYMMLLGMTLSDFGAGRTMTPRQQEPDQDSAEAIAAICGEILTGTRYARQARVLADEIAALPAPSAVARALETLAAG